MGQNVSLSHGLLSSSRVAQAYCCGNGRFQVGEAKAQNRHGVISAAFCWPNEPSVQLNLDQGEGSKAPRAHILRWHTLLGVDLTHT